MSSLPTPRFDQFYRYPELTRLLFDYAEARPDLVQVESAGKSHEGRDIWVLTATNLDTGPAAEKPAFWADGNIHAAEVTASLACLHFIDALAPGGVLIYETFAAGNGSIGKPSNPAFLLEPGELLEVVRGRLRVIAYEDGFTDVPRPAYVQRICAVREAQSAKAWAENALTIGNTPSGPPRYALGG